MFLLSLLSLLLSLAALGMADGSRNDTGIPDVRCISAAESSSAVDFYVSPRGDDAASGRAASTPFATLHAASTALYAILVSTGMSACTLGESEKARAPRGGILFSPLRARACATRSNFSFSDQTRHVFSAQSPHHCHQQLNWSSGGNAEFRVHLSPETFVLDARGNTSSSDLAFFLTLDHIGQNSTNPWDRLTVSFLVAPAVFPEPPDAEMPKSATRSQDGRASFHCLTSAAHSTFSPVVTVSDLISDLHDVRVTMSGMNAVGCFTLALLDGVREANVTDATLSGGMGGVTMVDVDRGRIERVTARDINVFEGQNLFQPVLFVDTVTTLFLVDVNVFNCSMSGTALVDLHNILSVAATNLAMVNNTVDDNVINMSAAGTFSNVTLINNKVKGSMLVSVDTKFLEDAGPNIILNQELTLCNWTIEGNSATSGMMIIYPVSETSDGLAGLPDIRVYLTDSVFRDNHASSGATLEVHNAEFTMINCQFLENQRTRLGSGHTVEQIPIDLHLSAGASKIKQRVSGCNFVPETKDSGFKRKMTSIYVSRSASVLFSDCEFFIGGPFGLTITMVGASVVEFEHCAFLGQSTNPVDFFVSIILALDGTNPRITSCLFDVSIRGYNNKFDVGDAFSLITLGGTSDFTVVQSVFKLRHSLDNSNVPGYLLARGADQSRLLLSQCTIEADYAVGIFSPATDEFTGGFMLIYSTVTGHFSQNVIDVQRSNYNTVQASKFVNVTTDVNHGLQAALLRFSYGTLNVNTVTFENNNATGIRCDGGGTLTLDESNFLRTREVPGTGPHVSVGGCFVKSTGSTMCGSLVNAPQTTQVPQLVCERTSTLYGSLNVNNAQGPCIFKTRSTVELERDDANPTSLIACPTGYPSSNFTFRTGKEDTEFNITLESENGPVLMQVFVDGFPFDMVRIEHEYVFHLDSSDALWQNNHEYLFSLESPTDTPSPIVVGSAYVNASLDLGLTNATLTSSYLGLRWTESPITITVAVFDSLDQQMLARDMPNTMTLLYGKEAFDLDDPSFNCSASGKWTTVEPAYVDATVVFSLKTSESGKVHLVVCLDNVGASSLGSVHLFWHAWVYIWGAAFVLVVLLIVALLVRFRFQARLRAMEEIVEIQRIRLNDYEEWEQDFDDNALPVLKGGTFLNTGDTFDATTSLISSSLGEVPHFHLSEIRHLLTPATRISRGAEGEVFKCMWKSRIVAVKVVDNGRQTEAVRDNFLAEVTALFNAEHPNILKILAVCLERNSLAFISECMGRGSLFRVLHDRNEQGALSLHRRLDLATQAASGLDYLHSLDVPVAHRDVKSLNVLVGSDWTVRIADFGTARAAPKTLLSVDKNHVGTPGWMSPEVLRGDDVSAKSDVFSFGVVLWEILTGQVPWEGRKFVDIVRLVGIEGGRLDTGAISATQLRRLDGDSEATTTIRAVLAEYELLVDNCFLQQADQRPSFADIVLVLQDLCSRIAHLDNK